MIVKLGINSAVDGVRLGDGIHPQRPPRADDPPDDASIIGDSQLAAFKAQGRPADERVIWAIPEKNARPVGRKQPSGRFRHLHQQRFDLASLVPLVGDFEHGLQTPQPPGLDRSTAQGRERAMPDGGEAVEHGQGMGRILGPRQSSRQNAAFARIGPKKAGRPTHARRSLFPIENLGRQFQRQRRPRSEFTLGTSLARLGRGKTIWPRRGRLNYWIFDDDRPPAVGG